MNIEIKMINIKRKRVMTMSDLYGKHPYRFKGITSVQKLYMDYIIIYIRCQVNARNFGLPIYCIVC